MNYIFTTARLGLRRFNANDSDAFAAINADPEVMRYFVEPLSHSESDAIMERIEKQYLQHGYCLYAVDYLADDQFIGFIGFLYSDWDSEYTPCTEIGWRLDKKYWGKGLATEGAKACLDYARVNLDLPEIYSWTAVPNLASAGVMKKIGMKYIGNFEHPEVPLGHPLREHVVYKI